MLVVSLRCVRPAGTLGGMVLMLLGLMSVLNMLGCCDGLRSIPTMERRLYPCPECPREFGTATGLGVHAKRAHPEFFNRRIHLERSRKRWSDEELRLLARQEVDLIRRGVRGVLAELVRLFPGRTIDGIKGARRKHDYSVYLREAREEDEMEFVVSSGPLTACGSSSLAARECMLQSSYSDLDNCDPSWNVLMLKEMIGLALAGQRFDDVFSLWVEITFPPELSSIGEEDFGPPCRNTLNTRPVFCSGRRRDRRTAFADIQELWRRDRRAAVSVILDGDRSGCRVSMDDMAEHWLPVFQEESVEWTGADLRFDRVEDFGDLMDDFPDDEIRASSVDLRSAPGVDGVTSRMWFSVPVCIKRTLFNLFLFKSSVPLPLCSVRVTWVPKTESPRLPSDYRPIAVASVMVRHLHKILANRFARGVSFHGSQRGFLAGRDGVAESVVLLNRVLKSATVKRRELHLAVLDIAKAFDSVSHKSLFALLRARGLPSEFIQYIERVYSVSGVVFGKGNSVHRTLVRRGVRQGDPLSPLLFNIAMDFVLDRLPKNIGYFMDGSLVGSMAYADDLVLCATSRAGMNTLLQSAVESLGHLGLRVNASKSRSLSLVPSGRQKLIGVSGETGFYIGEVALRPLTVLDSFRYLGVDFGFDGVLPGDAPIERLLVRVDAAPLKPRQKVMILKDYVLPRFHHALVLGGVAPARLRGWDVVIRSYLRKWLHLPHDSPNAFFHAAMRFGGLGVSSLSHWVPLWRRRRIRAALLGLGVETDEQVICSRNEVRKALADRLYGMVDGRDLLRSSDVPASTFWLRSDSAVLSREYVQFMRMWTGSLPTRVRTSRGSLRMLRSNICRRCHSAAETLAHVVQVCSATHGGRCLRHDACVIILCGALQRAGWTVVREARLPRGDSFLKPDIVAYRNGAVYLLDFQIVSGLASLEDLNRRKERKYSGEELALAVRRMMRMGPSAPVQVVGVTITWKGVWFGASAARLKRMGLLDLHLCWISERALRGSHMNWSRFNADGV